MTESKSLNMDELAYQALVKFSGLDMEQVKTACTSVQLRGMKRLFVKNKPGKGRQYEYVMSSSPYRTHEIPKKSGGKRIISEPCLELLTFQSAFKAYLYKYPTHEALFGGQPGRSQILNARHHFWKNCSDFSRAPKWTACIDVKDAFPSVKTELLRDVLTKIMKRDLDSFTFGDNRRSIILWPEHFVELFVEQLLSLVTHQGCLPQGAPTSPYLLNLALVHTGVIGRIEELCKTYHKMSFYDNSRTIRFSVYVDDFTFSSKREKISNRFLEKVIAIIEKGGVFRVNSRKTRRNNLRHQAHKITGVKITKMDFTPDTPYGSAVLSGLTKKYLKHVRGVLHRVIKILNSGQKLDKDRDGISIHEVWGHIAWIKSVYKDHRKLPSEVRHLIAKMDQISAQKKALAKKQMKIKWDELWKSHNS